MVLVLGAEYLARTLLVVYVGAIAVLFLFELWVVRSGDLVSSPGTVGPESTNWSHRLDPVPLLQIFGQVLYTQFVYYFLVAGLVLLAAMIAAIVLTMSARTQVKRQHLFEQLSRNNDLSIFLVKD